MITIIDKNNVLLASYSEVDTEMAVQDNLVSYEDEEWNITFKIKNYESETTSPVVENYGEEMGKIT